jgi:hypothetical protein
MRVGYELACYHLGRIDRAKAAFERAVDVNLENVEAFLALAVLKMGSLDSSVQSGKAVSSGGGEGQRRRS